MTIQFTLVSRHAPLVTLVREFALGLGYAVEDDAAQGEIRFAVRDGAEMLLHVLTHVALGATKLGVDLQDAICRVRFREPHAAAAVEMNLRLADITLHSPAGEGPATV